MPVFIQCSMKFVRKLGGSLLSSLSTYEQDQSLMLACPSRNSSIPTRDDTSRQKLSRDSCVAGLCWPCHHYCSYFALHQLTRLAIFVTQCCKCLGVWLTSMEEGFGKFQCLSFQTDYQDLEFVFFAEMWVNIHQVLKGELQESKVFLLNGKLMKGWFGHTNGWC